MGQKYGPQDPVRLKKEVLELTAQVSALTQQRDILNGEVARIMSDISDARDEYAKIRESIETRIKELGESLLLLESKMADLEKAYVAEKQRLDELRGVKRVTVMKIKTLSAKKPTEFSGVREALAGRVAALESKKSALEDDIGKSLSTHEDRSSELQRLNVEIEMAKQELFALDTHIESRKQEKAKLEAEYMSLSEVIRVTYQRERDISVMYNRMSEKYQAIYGAMPGKK